MEVVYVPYEKIDKNKWDDCITKSKNSLIYCRAFYLDNCTGNQWDAIVLDDYEAVMPATYRKKYGIKYLYQPAFLPQAGIFSEYDLSPALISGFIKAAASRYKFIEISLNYGNRGFDLKGAETTVRNNFVLDLTGSYERISSKYKSNFRKNLKEANKHDLSFRTTDKYSEIIYLFRKLYGKRMPSVTEKDYKNLEKNCNYLAKHNNLIAREVILGNTLLAAVILFKDGRRLYNITSCITPEGRKSSANYFLYNKIIEEFSDGHLLLDLEGSDIKGIADFYMSMNPVNEKYISVRLNNLPRLIKLFKK